MKIPRDGTLLILLPFYLDDCLVRDQSSRTVEGKRSSLNAFVAWCLTGGVKFPSEISEEHICDYRKYLYQYRQPRNGKELCIATRRRRLTDVNVWFRWLKRKNVINEDPTVNVELPQVPRQLGHRYLTMHQAEAVCNQTVVKGFLGQRDRAMLEMYYATGIRRMELARLDLDDVDLSEALVTVRFGKGGRQRRVPVAKRALHWLGVYMHEVRPKLIKLDSGFTLFLDNRGKRFREQQLTKMVSRYTKLAGVKKPGACNLFRHTTATLMLQNRADIRVVQEMMGHADISTTMAYTHVVQVHLRDVYQKTHPAACGFSEYPGAE